MGRHSLGRYLLGGLVLGRCELGRFVLGGLVLVRCDLDGFLVDRHVVGGRNVGDAYFGKSEKYKFRDLDVLTVGPVVEQMSAAFDEYFDLFAKEFIA